MLHLASNHFTRWLILASIGDCQILWKIIKSVGDIHLDLHLENAFTGTIPCTLNSNLPYYRYKVGEYGNITTGGNRPFPRSLGNLTEWLRVLLLRFRNLHSTIPVRIRRQPKWLYINVEDTCLTGALLFDHTCIIYFDSKWFLLSICYCFLLIVIPCICTISHWVIMSLQLHCYCKRFKIKYIIVMWWRRLRIKTIMSVMMKELFRHIINDKKEHRHIACPNLWWSLLQGMNYLTGTIL